VRLEAKVLTVSDSVANHRADDRSGTALVDCLNSAGFDVVDRAVSPDGVEPVTAALRAMSEHFTGVIVTTGGTGFAPRDVTPEATLGIIERRAPGLAEAMRLSGPSGRLSRAEAGVVGRCLVINTPGSPGGAVDFLAAIIDVLPHALELLAGQNPHGHHHAGSDSGAPS